MTGGRLYWWRIVINGVCIESRSSVAYGSVIVIRMDGSSRLAEMETLTIENNNKLVHQL